MAQPQRLARISGTKKRETSLIMKELLFTLSSERSGISSGEQFIRLLQSTAGEIWHRRSIAAFAGTVRRRCCDLLGFSGLTRHHALSSSKLFDSQVRSTILGFRTLAEHETLLGAEIVMCQRENGSS